jgi:hypothetical protein
MGKKRVFQDPANTRGIRRRIEPTTGVAARSYRACRRSIRSLPVQQQHEN